MTPSVKNDILVGVQDLLEIGLTAHAVTLGLSVCVCMYVWVCMRPYLLKLSLSHTQKHACRHTHMHICVYVLERALRTVTLDSRKYDVKHTRKPLSSATDVSSSRTAFCITVLCSCNTRQHTATHWIFAAISSQCRIP